MRKHPNLVKIHNSYDIVSFTIKSHLLFQRYPEYYQVITEPIDLKTIATKIVEGEYTTINQCEDDLNLMCKNAMTFNEPGSQVSF